MMKIELAPIGFVKTDVKKVPRHWTISDVEGAIVIDEQYKDGLKDIKDGQRIVVLFYFHQSLRFTLDLLMQKPKRRNSEDQDRCETRKEFICAFQSISSRRLPALRLFRSQ